MRSKAPLILIEMLIMLTVFAFTAGLCSKAFVYSSNQADESYMRDAAVRHAENAVQIIKSCGGDMGEAAKLLGAEGHADGFAIQITEDSAVLTLTADKKDDANEYLGTAKIAVTDEEEREIFSLDACWLEVKNYE